MMQMHISVFTALPQILEGPFSASLLGKARERGVVDLRVHDLRQHATDRHRSVDDSPFGGGAGMVLAPEPVFGAVEAVQPPRPLFLLDPGGRRFDQAMAHELAAGAGGSRCCAAATRASTSGCAAHLVDGELSVGDYVLAGGEAAAFVVIEAVARLVPGVMGNEASAGEESFSRRAPRVPALHPAGRVPGLGRARGAAVGRPRQVARWRRAPVAGPDAARTGPT